MKTKSMYIRSKRASPFSFDVHHLPVPATLSVVSTTHRTRPTIPHYRCLHIVCSLARCVESSSLCRRSVLQIVACPVSVPVLHIRAQDARNAAVASRDRVREEVGTEEAEGDVDPHVRGPLQLRQRCLVVRERARRRKGRVEHVDAALRRNGMFEHLLCRCVHDDELRSLVRHIFYLHRCTYTHGVVPQRDVEGPS